MTEACVTINAENVKPRVDESRDDSTEVTSRMNDGDTPVEGLLVSAEVSSRSEGVSPSRKRGSEEGGLPKDAIPECADVGRLQQSVARRVPAAQEGPGETMRQALAASSAREAFAASNGVWFQCARHSAV